MSQFLRLRVKLRVSLLSVPLAMVPGTEQGVLIGNRHCDYAYKQVCTAAAVWEHRDVECVRVTFVSYFKHPR